MAFRRSWVRFRLAAPRTGSALGEECENGEYQRKKPSQFPVDAFVRRHRPAGSERLALFRAGESSECLAGDATSAGDATRLGCAACARGAVARISMRQPRAQGLCRYLPAPHGTDVRTSTLRTAMSHRA